jgi:hypothetical protein
MRRAALTFVLALLAACAVRSELVAQPAAGATHVFELRTYTTHPGRLEALIRRFRDHTTRIFEKHGMVNVGYWVPQDPPLSDNTLVYLLQHESREAAEASWSAFGADPEWQEVRDASQADGPIVISVERVFMDPTDFSGIQ